MDMNAMQMAVRQMEINLEKTKLIHLFSEYMELTHPVIMDNMQSLTVEHRINLTNTLENLNDQLTKLGLKES